MSVRNAVEAHGKVKRGAEAIIFECNDEKNHRGCEWIVWLCGQYLWGSKDFAIIQPSGRS
jgi:hypothetical protein